MSWRATNMGLHTKLIFVLCFVNFAMGNPNSGTLFTEMFKTITNALIASGANGPAKQQIYPSESTGISSSVYNALHTITKNDELQCVPRLLCEAVAGGKPGANRQLNIDTNSLSTLISYLQLDQSNISPMLAFGKAVALGLSNRGDPYSCIINYPKCPKDETRLLYYLNNHRGGFFRFFDMKLPHQNYQYGQSSYYTQFPSGAYKPNQYYYSRKPQDLFKPKENSVETYAKTYAHSQVLFPSQEDTSTRKITFPSSSSEELPGEPRIQTKPVSELNYAGGIIPNLAKPSENFLFSNSKRYGKNIKESSFFPNHLNPVSRPTKFVTDRLPIKFYFPENNSIYHNPSPNNKALFFPKN